MPCDSLDHFRETNKKSIAVGPVSTEFTLFLFLLVNGFLGKY